MKPEWWTNGKACSRIPRVMEIWREQGNLVEPLHGGRAILAAEQRGMEKAAEIAIANAHEDCEVAEVIAAAIRQASKEITP